MNFITTQAGFFKSFFNAHLFCSVQDIVTEVFFAHTEATVLEDLVL